MSDREYQKVFITLQDGREVVYTGAVQINEGDCVKKVRTTPPIPLPADCILTDLETLHGDHSGAKQAETTGRNSPAGR